MATWLENQRDKARREKLSRELTHQQSYGQTSPQAQAMVDYASVTQDPNYVEQGLEGGVPTENVTGLGLSPLDLIGTGLGTKAAAFGGSMLAALAATGIASKASKGARLSELAMAMPSQRGIFAGVKDVVTNPSTEKLKGMLNRSGEKALRGVKDAEGNLHFWDAMKGTHEEGAKFAGVPYDYEKRLYVSSEDGMPLFGDYKNSVTPQDLSRYHNEDVLFNQPGHGLITGEEYKRLNAIPVEQKIVRYGDGQAISSVSEKQQLADLNKKRKAIGLFKYKTYDEALEGAKASADDWNEAMKKWDAFNQDQYQ